VTPSVSAPGDTNPNDATGVEILIVIYHIIYEIYTTRRILTI